MNSINIKTVKYLSSLWTVIQNTLSQGLEDCIMGGPSAHMKKLN